MVGMSHNQRSTWMLLVAVGITLFGLGFFMIAGVQVAQYCDPERRRREVESHAMMRKWLGDSNEVADDPKYFTRVSIPEHEPRLEFYFKAHCPGCKLFKPVWKQLFDEHPPSKFIALDPMDCDKNDFRDSGISNVPTIVFRANANAKFIKYSGASSSRDIYKWTKLQLKDIRTNKDDV